jgi:hypothetical protein
MPKRWFDLLATIIFVIFIVITSDQIYSIGMLNKELLITYLAYIMIAFALRGFFSNKEK